MNEPLVSVIIPIYNSIQYIEECVDSVVNQSYKNLEIILIDDGSTDGTLHFLLKTYSHLTRIKILTHPNNENKGVTLSRRLGIDFSNGEYLAFLDADDFFDLNKIDKQVKIISENNDVVLIHSKIKFLNEIRDDNFFYDFSFECKDKKYDLNLDTFINVNHICNSTVLVRRDLFIKVSFSGNLAFQYEDWIQWVLLAEYGKYFYMNMATCTYRYHSNSSTAVLNRSGKINLYANFEKNIVLEYELRGKKKHYILLKHLQKSLDDLYNNLHYKNQAPVMFFNEIRLLKKIFKFYLILKLFLKYFKK